LDLGGFNAPTRWRGCETPRPPNLARPNLRRLLLAVVVTVEGFGINPREVIEVNRPAKKVVSNKVLAQPNLAPANRDTPAARGGLGIVRFSGVLR
jgi:hypothetical protein